MNREEAYHVYFSEIEKPANKIDVEKLQAALEIIMPYEEAEDAVINARMYPALLAQIDKLESRKRRNLIRKHFTMRAIVALVRLIVVGSAVAYSKGYDVWKIVVKWSSEHFTMWISSKEEMNIVELAEVDKSVAEIWGGDVNNAITTLDAVPVLPSWRPEGFDLVECNMTKIEGIGTSIHAAYESKDGHAYILHIQTTSAPYVDGKVELEADAKLQEEVVADSLHFYIMSNYQKRKVIWYSNGASIMISGDLTELDIHEMIQSIGENNNEE